ncbi:MAG: glycosyltransferase [Pirellulales bacterium]
MGHRRISRIAMISTHGYVAAMPELGKPDTGGQVAYVLALSRHLARMGYQVDIMTRQFEDQPAMERVDQHVQILRFPCGGSDFLPKETLCEAIPEWSAHALRSIKKQRLRYEFVNSHYWDAGLAGQLLARTLRTPHIHTPHSIGSWKRDNTPGDSAEKERRWNFAHRIREEKVIYDGCDGLIATTMQQRDVLCGSEYDVAPSKIYVIPPGYDDTRFYPVSLATRRALKKELGLGGLVVLALGRLAQNKGYDLLIRSMMPVFARVPEARLLLAIGSTQMNDDEIAQLSELQQLAERLGLADRVMFHDYIPDDELANYYRASDVFALSSRYEPFGMTAIEAMACGTPTVITTEGGLWEQVTWGLEALYADPNDTDAFGHAICEILQYPQVSDQLARNGSQKARSYFTWTGVSQQIVNLVDAEVTRPHGSAPTSLRLRGPTLSSMLVG